MNETILIEPEKMLGTVEQGFLRQTWKTIKRINDIQHYSVYSSLSGEQFGFIIDNVHVRLPENEIGLIIPFDETEKTCWECGGRRMLEIKINFDCFCTEWQEWCYNPQYKRIRK